MSATTTRPKRVPVRSRRARAEEEDADQQWEADTEAAMQASLAASAGSASSGRRQPATSDLTAADGFDDSEFDPTVLELDAPSPTSASTMAEVEFDEDLEDTTSRT